jgi:UDPglucose 6-dehydrogenase
MDHVRSIYGNRITLCDKMYDVLEGADCLAIMTEWNEFRTPDFEHMAATLSEKIIFDGRNVYDTEQMKELGFQYVSMGRPKVRGKKG